jgi:hypothetical protein
MTSVEASERRHTGIISLSAHKRKERRSEPDSDRDMSAISTRTSPSEPQGVDTTLLAGVVCKDTAAAIPLFVQGHSGTGAP